MYPELTPSELWLLSTGAGAAAFFVLTVVLVLVEARHAAFTLLRLASAATAAWFGLLMAAPLLHFAAPALDLAESIRTGLWLVVAAWLMPVGPDRAARTWQKRIGVALPLLFGLFLAGRLLMTFVHGSPTAGHSPVFAIGEVLMSLWGLMLVEQLFRVSATDARWAIKYLCLALATIFLYDFLMYSVALLSMRIDLSVWDARGIINAVAAPMIAVAAARNAQWSARVSVSHRAVFQTTVMLAAGVYLLVVAIGGYYIRRSDGDWSDVAALVFLAISILGLVILLLSGRFRANVRVLLNKHLFNYKYDYREEWLSLTRQLSRQDDTASGYQRAIRAVARVSDSPAGALWALRDDRFQCVEHWNMPEASDVSEAADASLVDFLESTGWIVDLTERHKNPARYERLVLPVWFEEIKQARLVMPLFAAANRMVGFMLLSHSRAEFRLGWEEIDLLRTFGQQVGVYVEQQESNRALTQARQFETFNRLTAFLMHDLKNIAGQQSLMLQNAARHRHKPEFIDDMILTIDNSVQRMRQVLDQLQRVSTDERSVQRVSVDQVIAQALAATADVNPVATMVGELSKACVQVDRDRLVMIMRHVIRNAQEATPADGWVNVSTVCRDGVVDIMTSDSGEGMNAEFIRDSLFQPFSSTKAARGMGIGAYQARDFAREAGGDIAVESQVGVGTRFTVRLPLAEADHSASDLDAADAGSAGSS